jgi:hypothetical protein
MMMEDIKTAFLLKIPMGTRKNFSENCRQFGKALSKRFASPGLGPLENGFESHSGHGCMKDLRFHKLILDA